jgi:LSD1 subclass zinc finger protein
MQVVCKGCRKHLEVPESALGKILRCPSCKRTFSLDTIDIADPVAMPGIRVHHSVPPPPSCSMDELVSAAQTASSSGPPISADVSQRGHLSWPQHTPRPKWLLPLAIVFIIGLLGLVALLSGVLNVIGITVDRADIRKVIADPHSYAGQTLKSQVIMEGTSCFRGIGADGVLVLEESDALAEKAGNILGAIGEHQHVMIKYRLYDKATLAKTWAAYESGTGWRSMPESGILIDIWIP